MSAVGDFKYYQWIPSVDNESALLQSIGPQQSNKYDHGKNIEKDENGLETTNTISDKLVSGQEEYLGSCRIDGWETFAIDMRIDSFISQGGKRI